MVKVSEQKLSSTSGTFESTNDKAIYWTVNMVLEVAVIIKNETNNTSLALAVITILVYGIPCFWGHKKRRKGWGGLLGGGGGVLGWAHERSWRKDYENWEGPSMQNRTQLRNHRLG